MTSARVRVLCVDDNEFIGEAVERRLRTHPELEWAGWLPDAMALEAEAASRRADIVLLDLNLPARDSLEALRALTEHRPATRVVMLTGHVRPEDVDRSIEHGAMGYVSKNDDSEAIIDAIRRVARGEFALSPEVEASQRRG